MVIYKYSSIRFKLNHPTQIFPTIGEGDYGKFAEDFLSTRAEPKTWSPPYSTTKNQNLRFAWMVSGIAKKNCLKYESGQQNLENWSLLHNQDKLPWQKIKFYLTFFFLFWI